MNTGLCKCGKPVAHLSANEDSAEWICRVRGTADFTETSHGFKRHTVSLNNRQKFVIREALASLSLRTGSVFNAVRAECYEALEAGLPEEVSGSAEARS